MSATTKPCLKRNRASNPKEQNSKEFPAHESPLTRKWTVPRLSPTEKLSCHPADNDNALIALHPTIKISTCLLIKLLHWEERKWKCRQIENSSPKPSETYIPSINILQLHRGQINLHLCLWVAFPVSCLSVDPNRMQAKAWFPSQYLWDFSVALTVLWNGQGNVNNCWWWVSSSWYNSSDTVYEDHLKKARYGGTSLTSVNRGWGVSGSFWTM